MGRKARVPQTRGTTHPLLFGTVLFLASETLFFGGLFAAYFTLRAQTPVWPPAGISLDTSLSAIATVLLILSSGTFELGIRAARLGKLGALKRWIWLTALLGAVFLSIQVWDWTHVPFAVSSNAYGTLYFAMTGFHGLHVLAGVLLMGVVLGRLAQGAYRDGRIEGAEAIGYYWHFVDVVWIFLFATLFLLR